MAVSIFFFIITKSLTLQAVAGRRSAGKVSGTFLEAGVERIHLSHSLISFKKSPECRPESLNPKPTTLDLPLVS